jgi:hypothetical protein
MVLAEEMGSSDRRFAKVRFAGQAQRARHANGFVHVNGAPAQVSVHSLTRTSQRRELFEIGKLLRADATRAREALRTMLKDAASTKEMV